MGVASFFFYLSVVKNILTKIPVRLIMILN